MFEFFSFLSFIDPVFLFICFVLIAVLLINAIVNYLRRTELDRFWKQTDFRYKNKYPRVLNPYDCEKGNYIKVYKVKMPIGMCKSDFVAKREHLEQYLNAQVTFEFNDDLIITIDRNKKPLP